jgi:hypothetical protein
MSAQENVFRHSEIQFSCFTRPNEFLIPKYFCRRAYVVHLFDDEDRAGATISAMIFIL